MKDFYAWAQQPTSVAGFAAAFGTVSAVLTHQISWIQAGPLLAGAVMSIVLPDNSGAKARAEALASSLVSSDIAKDSK